MAARPARRSLSMPLALAMLLAAAACTDDSADDQRTTTTPTTTSTTTGPGEFEGCVDFEDLALGATFVVGDVFSSGGVDIQVTEFTYDTGTTTSTGDTEVAGGGDAGGLGQDLLVNNVLVRFGFPSTPLDGLSFRFGEYGGNLNIRVNSDFVNFENFSEIDGAVIGGVTVSVVGGTGGDTGVATLIGSISDFAVGGQELFIDDLCTPIP